MKKETRATKINTQASILATQFSNLLSYLRDDENNDGWKAIILSELEVAKDRVAIIDRESKAIILE
jgi:hypothetical protein